MTPPALMECPNPWCEHKKLPKAVVRKIYQFRECIVECQDCGFEGPVRPTEAEAVAAWNERAPQGNEASEEIFRQTCRCHRCGAEGLILSPARPGDKEVERLRECAEAGYNLSKYAASIYKKDGDNTADWLVGLDEKIFVMQCLFEMLPVAALSAPSQQEQEPNIFLERNNGSKLGNRLADERALNALEEAVKELPLPMPMGGRHSDSCEWVQGKSDGGCDCGWNEQCDDAREEKAKALELIKKPTPAPQGNEASEEIFRQTCRCHRCGAEGLILSPARPGDKEVERLNRFLKILLEESRELIDLLEEDEEDFVHASKQSILHQMLILSGHIHHVNGELSSSSQQEPKP